MVLLHKHRSNSGMHFAVRERAVASDPEARAVIHEVVLVVGKGPSRDREWTDHELDQLFQSRDIEECRTMFIDTDGGAYAYSAYRACIELADYF